MSSSPPQSFEINKAMAMKEYRSFIFSIYLGAFLFFCSCNKDCKNIPGGYEFDLPVTLSPALDTFSIGDTIRIESVFEDRVYETKTKKRYHLDDWRFYPETRIMKIDSNPAQDGFDHFEVLIDEDIDYERFFYSSGTSGLIGQYNYSNTDGIYSLSYKIVARSKGMFLFYHAHLLYPLDEWQDFSGRCNGIGSDARTTLNGGEDNNVEYLRRSPDPHYSEWVMARPEERFHEGGGYCFYVVE